MSESVHFSQEKHIGFITLNRPQSLNALTLPMILAMQEQLLAWKVDDAIHAVVLQAANGKAFCAGGDVRWLYDAGKHQDPSVLHFFWHEYRLNAFIEQFGKPYIALMDGTTMGGGVGIALHGSHPIATEQFIFAMPETTIGFFPDIGASHLLTQCPGAWGRYLGLTGNRLNATEAQQLGLVKQVIASAQIPQLIRTLLEIDLSTHPHETIDHCLQTFVAPHIASTIGDLNADVAHAFNQSNVESILATLQTMQTPRAETLAASLVQKSPLSIKVTFEQLERAKGLSLQQCLQMDYGLVQHFMQNPNFYEGVRALLVDKDKSPQWQPKNLSAVKEDDWFGFFNPVVDELEFI